MLFDKLNIHCYEDHYLDENDSRYWSCGNNCLQLPYTSSQRTACTALKPQTQRWRVIMELSTTVPTDWLISFSGLSMMTPRKVGEYVRRRPPSDRRALWWKRFNIGYEVSSQIETHGKLVLVTQRSGYFDLQGPYCWKVRKRTGKITQVLNKKVKRNRITVKYRWQTIVTKFSIVHRSLWTVHSK